MNLGRMMAAATLISASHIAVAQENSFYAGAKLASYLIDESFAEEEFSELAWGGYAGYRFNQYIAVEAQYLLLSEDTAYGDNFEGDVFAITVRPTLPLGETWELFAKGGWHWQDAKITERVSGTPEMSSVKRFSASEDGAYWGAGVGWNFNGFHLRCEYEGSSSGPFGGLAIVGLGIGIDF